MSALNPYKNRQQHLDEPLDPELQNKHDETIDRAKQAAGWTKINSYAMWASIGLMATGFGLVFTPLNAWAVQQGLSWLLAAGMFVAAAAVGVVASVSSVKASKLTTENSFRIAELSASRTAKHLAKAARMETDRVEELVDSRVNEKKEPAKEPPKSWVERVSADQDFAQSRAH